MDKNSVISRIQETADPFTKYMKNLYEDGKFDKQFNDTWKIKDILAHIVWYEEEMTILVENQSLQSSSPIWNNELDKRNALIYEEMKDVSHKELIERHDAAVQKLTSAIEDLTDDHMEDPSLYDGMPEEWVPWQIIGGSSFFHYSDHLRRLQEFMEESQ